MTTTEWPARDFVRTDFLANILVEAGQDGVGGWAMVHELYFKEWGGNLLWAFMEMEEIDAEESVPVVLDDIEQGIQDIINGNVQVPLSHRRTIAEASATNRSHKIDAELADCIVQVGVLGGLLYRWEVAEGTS